MGEHPQIATAGASLAKIELALYCVRPAYVLVLRIILAYLISALDYVYKAMPLCPTRLRRTQRAVERVLTLALRVPRNGPKALLWMPVQPHASPARSGVSHGHGFAQCAGSRKRPNPPPPEPPERPRLPGLGRHPSTMGETHLELHVVPAAAARPAAVDTRVYRPYESGGVLLAADGAMEVTLDGNTLGWGALIADVVGVLATVASGVLTRAPAPGPPNGRAS